LYHRNIDKPFSELTKQSVMMFTKYIDTRSRIVSPKHR
jgi:hypothetical protein